MLHVFKYPSEEIQGADIIHSYRAANEPEQLTQETFYSQSI